MDGAAALREKLAKVEALLAGATTEGERAAAAAALSRLKARLAEQARTGRPVEMQFSLPDEWSRRLFLALCRRYGLSPYRRPRQKRTTVMVRLPRAFAEEVLWPEFIALDEVLRRHLLEVTLGVIRRAVHDDASEPGEEAGGAATPPRRPG